MTIIEKGKKGFDTVKKDNLYLQSIYDPVIEAKRFVGNIIKETNIQINSINNNCNYFFIFFGSGLGYLIDAILEYKINEDDIFVYEPDDVLLNYLKSKLQNYSKRITILNDNLNISEKIEYFLLNKKKPLIIAYDSYINAYREIYEKFKDYLFEIINQVKENIKVTSYFIKIWFINYFRNLKLYNNRYKIYYLRNNFDNIINYPVVIIASGPSLNKYFNILKKYQDYLIIVSVLSASRSLLLNNIKPDYIVISDAGIANKIHFYKIDINIPVLANVYSNSATLNSIQNKIIFYNLLEEFDSPTFNLKYPSVTIDAGLIFSKYFSKKNICFIGFDLSYDLHYGSHSPGNSLIEFEERKYNRFKTKLTKISSFLKRNDLIFNNNIISNKQFLLIRDYVNILFNDSNYMSEKEIFNLRKIDKLESFISRDFKHKYKNAFENYFFYDRNIIASIFRENISENILNKYYDKLLYKEILTESNLIEAKEYLKDKIEKILKKSLF